MQTDNPDGTAPEVDYKLNLRVQVTGCSHLVRDGRQVPCRIGAGSPIAGSVIALRTQ